MGLSKETDHNFEVVVADDGSGFETRKIIEKWKSRSPLRLIHAWQNDDGFRLNQSRNNGIKKSSGEYIVVLDGDCMPRRNFVAQHRKLMERGGQLREIGACYRRTRLIKLRREKKICLAGI